VEKFPGMGAKIGHDFDILSTCLKKIFPYPVRVSGLHQNL
jgi:hypothetical protein